MDCFLRRRPFPECIGLETALPSGKVYRYDHSGALMYNSGVIGVRPDHAPAIEDAIALIDTIRPLSARRAHDQEQFAIAEALRLHGVPIGVTWLTLKHYCPRWEKRYMYWRFERMGVSAETRIAPRRPAIMVNKPMGRLFKWMTEAKAIAWPLS
jgi:hypothetical protein